MCGNFVKRFNSIGISKKQEKTTRTPPKRKATLPPLQRSIQKAIIHCYDVLKREDEEEGISRTDTELITRVAKLMGVITILLVAIVFTRPSQSYREPCPPSCWCMKVTAVKCTDSHLEELPSDLNSNLTSLDISRNNLTYLPEDAFQETPGLRHLRLASNRITEIHKDAFSVLFNLSLVALQDNRITTLHPNSFINTSLRVLHLSWNNLVLPEHGPFIQSASLERLYLDHCNISYLPDEIFINSTNITSLKINGNSIKSINDQVFRPLSQLIFISIAQNELVTLHPGTFRYNNQLLQVDLTENTIHIPEDNFLRSTVNFLSLGSNGITHLPENTFRDLSRVETLFLHNNSISDLDIRVWKYLPKLTDLMLFNNNITSFDPDVFSENTELQRLYLRNNILKFDEGPILNTSKLMLLDIRSCNLSYLPPNAFEGMPSLEVLALSENNFEDIDINLFDTLKKLNHINVSDNPAVCSCVNEQLRTWAFQRNINLRTYCTGGALSKEICNDVDPSSLSTRTA